MVLKEISRRRNRRPAGTALAANDSFPMRDSRARLEALVRHDHSCSSVRSSSSLVGGSRICCRSESSSSPRKVRVVAGPSTLSMATGIDTQALTHLQQLLEVGGTLGGPGRTSEEVVVQVVDRVGEAVVVAEYPLEGIGVLIE